MDEELRRGLKQLLDYEGDDVEDSSNKCQLCMVDDNLYEINEGQTVTIEKMGCLDGENSIPERCLR